MGNEIAYDPSWFLPGTGPTLAQKDRAWQEQYIKDHPGTRSMPQSPYAQSNSLNGDELFAGKTFTPEGFQSYQDAVTKADKLAQQQGLLTAAGLAALPFAGSALFGGAAGAAGGSGGLSAAAAFPGAPITLTAADTAAAAAGLGAMPSAASLLPTIGGAVGTGATGAGVGMSYWDELQKEFLDGFTPSEPGVPGEFPVPEVQPPIYESPIPEFGNGLPDWLTKMAPGAAKTALTSLLGGSNGSAIGAALGGLLGGLGGNQGQQDTTTKKLDPRMDAMLYGGGGLLDQSKQWFDANKNGNPALNQGLAMRQAFYSDPNYGQGFGAMKNAGMGLLGGQVAGNPFTSGQMQMPQMGGGAPQMTDPRKYMPTLPTQYNRG